MVVLHLNTKGWCSSLSTEVPIKPIQHLVSPVPSERVGISLGSFTRRKPAVAGFTVGIIVGPLTGQRFDLNASVLNLLMNGEGHVGVDVPVLHALNEVD